MQRHDADSAKVLSNELAEVRKISKTLGQAKMALEQVSMRLSTIHELGDAMVALGPGNVHDKESQAEPWKVRSRRGRRNQQHAEPAWQNHDRIPAEQRTWSRSQHRFGGGDIDQIMMEASAVAEQKVTTGSLRSRLHGVQDFRHGKSA